VSHVGFYALDRLVELLAWAFARCNICAITITLNGPGSTPLRRALLGSHERPAVYSRAE